MPFGQVVLGIPTGILSLVQEGLLERAFHDGLYPAQQYRKEALYEKWEGNTGTEIFMSRPGLLRPVTKPTPPGQDPQPQTTTYEQWVARLDRYTGRQDVHMPTSAVSNNDLFLRNINQLGLQAAQSVNRISRNALFKAYLSGQTLTISAAAAADTTIRVASLNGFVDVVVPGTNVRPLSVSPASPLQVTIYIAGVATLRNVIGFQADNPADIFGPGTLTLSAAIGGAGAAARSPVVSIYAPTVIRSGGGFSVDALGAADTVTLQDVINGVAQLRRQNVQPHDDGFFHAHISSSSNAQLFADPVFQRLNQSLPEHATYKEGFIGTISGVMFFMNTESPDTLSSGALTATGVNAFYAEDVGGEVVNESGIGVGRIVITGKAALYELTLDETSYISEAGVTGKVAEFDIVNNNVQVGTERIRLIIAAPIDALQDFVRCSWSISTSFPVPSDVTATTGSQRYKRSLIIEHAA